MKFLLSTTAALAFANLIGNTHGHGYMFEPLSRNYYAWLNGVSWGTAREAPPKEYCTHCLNTKGPGSVCGTSENGINYDGWLDTLGLPMSWNSNGNVYREGAEITVSSFLASHHTGHMEVRACPDGRGSTQECFDKPENRLTFVEDLMYDMPQDEDHPERGYYYGSAEFNNQEFSMRWKLPDGMVGNEVLLQWWYFTANSCTPEGYANYYGANSGLGQDFWNPEIADCTPEQWTEEFYAGDWPERFVNCAEVTVVSEDPNDFINVDVGIGSPPPPVSTQAPVVIVETPEIVPPVIQTQPPTEAPQTPETPVAPETPEIFGEGCCSNDYKTCATWCSESKDQCESSACVNMKWLNNGAISSDATCEPRWGGCTNTGDAGCCEGLVCKGNSPYYKQCLAPAETAPN